MTAAPHDPARCWPREWSCPRCKTSPPDLRDAREGWCPVCHDWTVVDTMSEAESKAWHAGHVAGYNAALAREIRALEEKRRD